MIEIVNYVPDFENRRLLDHLAEFAGSILEDFNRKRHEVNIVLCNDDFIRSLNRKYRGKDSATDVLSFSQEEDGEEDFFDGLDEVEHPENGGKALGDIIISLETAARQSREFEVTEEEELGRLVIHGMLHLLGFDHETSKQDEKKMFARQDKYLAKFLKKYCH